MKSLLLFREYLFTACRKVRSADEIGRFTH
jgi:hypothetical protein